MDSVPCEFCGCTEYTCQSGFYICNNCDTQSQVIGTQHFDFVDFGRGEDNEEREEVRSEKSVTERKFTSWECYNKVLLGLVEELINLGASKEIKVLAFQLWASYLKWSNVAFISKTEEKVPALSLGFKNQDVDTLYGIPNLRSKVFKNSKGRWKRPKKRKDENESASESLSVASSSRSVKLRQRKIALDKSVNETDCKMPDVETLEDLDKERESQRVRKKNIVFKSSARNQLREIADQNDEPPADLETFKLRVKKRRSKVFKFVYDRTCKASSENAPLSTVTLITILRVALQLANEEIFLADILRWICEGRLSVNQPEKFVPLFYTYVKKNDLMNIHRRGFQLDIRNFTYNLNLYDLPTPNLYKLAERYCSELCVPDEFLKLVLKLMVNSKLEMNYEKYKFRIFPDYECRVMAFILFVFKLLFSLDDFTEFQQSDFADAVNELQQSQSKDGIPKLFSWNSWMKFMECRKSVLSSYNASISQQTCYEKYCEENVFLDHWEKVKPTYESNRKEINEALLSSLSQEIGCQSFLHVERGEEFVAGPASVTPWSSLTEHILKDYSSYISLRSKEILSESFKSHSIKHVMDSKWCSDIAESLKMKVELCNADDQFDLEIYERSNCSFSVYRNYVTRTPLNHLVPVLLHSQESSMNSACELHQFRGSVNENYSKSACQYQKYDVKLNSASPHWCFHECSVLKIEEFENLAGKVLPRSFRWLLRECAAMLRIDAKELYCELILVESVLYRLYAKEDLKKSYIKINTNEW